MDKFNDFVNRLNEKKEDPIITWLVGPPASGKSTWRESNAKGAFIISRDDLVDELRKGTGMSYADTFADSAFQGRVNKALDSEINRALNSGKNIIVDMTNMNAKSRSRIMKLVPNNYIKNAVVFDTPRGEILRRLKKREEETGKRVGISIVDSMIKSYEEPTKSEGFDNIEHVK